MKLQESKLYVPPIGYPTYREFGSDKLYSHPYGAQERTQEVLRHFLAYRHLSTGRTELSSALPLVSTNYFFCQGLITENDSWWHSLRALSHVVQGRSPQEHVDLIQRSFHERGLSASGTTIVMCPGFPEAKDEFVAAVREAGLRVKDVIETPKVDDWTAPQTDIITNPLTRKTTIITDGRDPIEL